MLKKAFKNFKNENGFTGQELLISMFILVLFLGIMTTVYVNLSNTSYEIKLAAKATEILTTKLETYEEMYYDQINTGTEDSIIENKYTILTDVEANEEEKTIKVSVSYDWKGDTHRIKNSMVKYKENIKPQNSPELKPEYNLTPVKYVYDNTESLEGHWEKTDATDTDWYNYENNRWAVAVEGATFKKDENGNDMIILSTCTNVYVWVPKYYYDTTTNEFAYFGYKDTDMVIKVDEKNKYSLESASTEKSYFDTDKTGEWIKVSFENKELTCLETDADKDKENIFDIINDDKCKYNAKNTIIPNTSE